MDAFEFLKERKRMCNSYKGCGGCPLERGNCGLNTSTSNEKCERIITAVEQWSKEHPRKTRQSVFLEQWPNCMMGDDDVVGMCPRSVDKMYACNGLLSGGCSDCRRNFWMQEVE